MATFVYCPLFGVRRTIKITPTDPGSFKMLNSARQSSKMHFSFHLNSLGTEQWLRTKYMQLKAFYFTLTGIFGQDLLYLKERKLIKS